MTKGYGAKLTPEQGCLSSLKCLFGQTVKSGYYYGSDGLRSSLTVSWDPGTPEYQGEADPDASKYNKWMWLKKQITTGCNQINLIEFLTDYISKEMQIN